MPIKMDIRENILIDGSYVSMEEAASYATKVSLAVQQINADLEAKAQENADELGNFEYEQFVPSDSEIMLAMALIAFKENQCALCVIESDHNKPDPSKFLPTPFAAIICGTIPSGNKKEISKIRSYISRGIQEIVSAPQNEDAYRIISDTCVSVGCRLTLPTMSRLTVERLALKATDFSYKDLSYSMKLCGRFELINAAVALESFDMLCRRGYNISYENVKNGLAKLSIPTKFEILSSTPYIIADSTHKPVAIEIVCDSMTDFKDITGTKVRLCLPDGEIIQNYVNALTSRGYTIESIITVSESENGIIEDLQDIEKKAVKSYKLAAKEAVKELEADTILLISGPYSFTSEVRYEVLAILNF